jgi:hypothetical protein
MDRRVFRTSLAPIAAALVLASAQPATSDDLAGVQNALKTATAAVHSFRIDVSVTAMGMNMSTSMTIIREPVRMHMLTKGPFLMEMFVSDGFLYMHIGTAAWTKQQLPAASTSLDMMRAITSAVHTTVGPDVTEDGVTYGSLDVQADAGAVPGVPLPAMTLSCRYDKQTYLMHDCKTDLFTENFSGYNDPANVVVLPADAAGAVAGPPLALPAPSPAPTASPQ